MASALVVAWFYTYDNGCEPIDSVGKRGDIYANSSHSSDFMNKMRAWRDLTADVLKISVVDNNLAFVRTKSCGVH